MNIQVTQENLLKAVEVVVKGISGSSKTNPVLEGVCFSVVDENQVILRVCNDQHMTFETKLESTLLTKGEAFVVNGKKFSELVRKMPAGELILTASETSLTMASTVCELAVPVIAQTAFPEAQSIENGIEFDVSAAELQEAIHLTSFCICTDETRAIFTGYNLDITKDKLRISALDGYKVATTQISVAANSEVEGNITVPSKALNEVVKIISSDKDRSAGIVSITCSDKTVRFRSNETTVTVNTLAGKFIDCKKQFNLGEPMTAITVNKKAFLATIDRASSLGNDKKANVSLNINEKTTVTCHTELGKMNEKVNNKFSGEALKINFNSRYLFDTIQRIDEEEVTLQLYGSDKPVIIGSKKSKYLILPVRQNA